MALLTCEDLSFSYDGETVLRGVSFSVSAGDYLCVVGENGSGKSTLMKGLLGLKTPSSGSITLADGLSRDGIGYLPQQTDLQRDFPASVMEVTLSGRVSSMGRRPFHNAGDKKAAMENLERMGAAELAGRCYQELSGGQQQRVLLARALCSTKRLLLLDEPVAGLDPLATVEMYNLVKLINLCDGVTVLMVSHDVDAALRYATHILHLGHSQLFFGTVAEYRNSDASRRLRGGEGL
ncbi:MAG: metal ABC transporter ATP-binding protein [Oscillospiraceae bacterium]